MLSTQRHASRRSILRPLKEIYNDRLLTDRYLGGTNAIGLIDEDVYPNLYWYENETNATTRNAPEPTQRSLGQGLERLPTWCARDIHEILPQTTPWPTYSPLSMGAIGVDLHVSNPLSAIMSRFA